MFDRMPKLSDRVLHRWRDTTNILMSLMSKTAHFDPLSRPNDAFAPKTSSAHRFLRSLEWTSLLNASYRKNDCCPFKMTFCITSCRGDEHQWRNQLFVPDPPTCYRSPLAVPVHFFRGAGLRLAWCQPIPVPRTLIDVFQIKERQRSQLLDSNQ